jgi:hypothetical protein
MYQNNVRKGIRRALMVPLLAGLILAGLPGCQADTQDDTDTVEPTAVEVVAELPLTATAVPATLPPPMMLVHTNTPVPATATPIPTDTPPPPTETAEPSATAVPPTNTPVPVRPANTAVPPTATAVPPTAPPVGANGLIASLFEIQERAVLQVNQPVWFGFNVANSTGGDVPYNALGVMPRKDGVDRKEWYQQSYGGPDSVIRPGGLEWEDNIKLPEAGNYTLRLVICFDGFDACLQQRATWHTLSQEIPVTIQ